MAKFESHSARVFIDGVPLGVAVSWEVRVPMTESEWLASVDPARMVRACRPGPGEVGFIIHEKVGELAYRISDRKLRLFTCACLIEEGAGSADHVYHSYENPGKVFGQFGITALEWAENWCRTSTHPTIPSLAVRAALLREIVGNPWRPVPEVRRKCELCRGGKTVTEICEEDVPVIYPCWKCHSTGCSWISPWLTWQDRTVPRLAENIYERRAFEELPLLADALTEAGCEEQELLMHLRGYERCWLCVRTNSDPAKDACSVCGQLGRIGPYGRPCAPGWQPLRGPHVRGCWAMDLILGKD